MSCGAIIAAPAVVFSAIFGWDLPAAVALIGVPTVLYTMLGGVQAVTWADVKQMVLIVFSLFAIVIVLLVQMPVSPDEALRIAGTTGRLRTFDFSFNLTDTYTFWSGVIGGFFLMLSYFGTDQSQVQRYLTARSVPEARTSLLMSAYWKIPLQALVLLIGVLVFVFYVFQAPPLLFNPAHEAAVRARGGGVRGARGSVRGSVDGARPRAPAGRNAEARPRGGGAAAQFRSGEARVSEVRAAALDLAQRVTGQTPRDVNYIIPHFVLTLPAHRPGRPLHRRYHGGRNVEHLVGTELAVDCNVIDFYRRWVRPHGSDQHLLRVSKFATAFWGLFACFVATYAVRSAPSSRW
jgi:solute:Na+ symporter, SSS family